MKFKGIIIAAIGLLFASQVNAQDIQDKFIGMKLGTVQTESSIKTSVGERGEFIELQDRGEYMRFYFRDMFFVGRKWDFAYFYRNPNKQFYEFKVQSYYSEKNEALELYNSFKNRLNNKYGSPDEDKEEANTQCITYYGDNNTDMMLVLEYMQSTGGTYYYYVSLDYINEELYFSVQDAIDNEL